MGHKSIAVQKSGANRNFATTHCCARPSIAVQKSGANRNTVPQLPAAITSIAVQKSGANRNHVIIIQRIGEQHSSSEIGGQPQRREWGQLGRLEHSSSEIGGQPQLILLWRVV